MAREWSDHIAGVAAVVTSGWLFATGAIAALSGASLFVLGRPGRPWIVALIQLVLAVFVVAAAVTVGRAVPRIWAGGVYRRRAVAWIALTTTLLAALGLLVTQQAGLIAIVVPSLTLLRLSSRPAVSLTGYHTEPHPSSVDKGGVG